MVFKLTKVMSFSHNFQSVNIILFTNGLNNYSAHSTLSQILEISSSYGENFPSSLVHKLEVSFRLKTFPSCFKSLSF